MASSRYVDRRRVPLELAYRVEILGAAGRIREARTALERLIALTANSHVPTVYLALAYAGVRDFDTAFRYVDRMIEEHGWGVIGFEVDPEWDAFRRDPRFARALSRVGLPGE